ncbi:ribonuclease domain-containing protein [Mycobacterium paraterrae]|uniref:Ribonuclease n=1 Tax=Mycobacterium paraterrae TaxID=577492 RepID=A0ABY3VJG5_9MYCO|nr:ribonuclease domain-containing protein [Mycobacterium paraterrae]UMB69441.1 ribonuclease [Mycobacterium paraterrae]
MTRRKLLLVAACALVVVIGGWELTHVRPSGPAQPTARGVDASACPIATLPPEVTDTVRRIHAGGPFPFPRSDGEVFANHEGHLPTQRRGYYHEYTVITPRARDRSMRRIVTGGTPLAHPAQYFYTGDHYESFCLITDAGGAP